MICAWACPASRLVLNLSTALIRPAMVATTATRRSHRRIQAAHSGRAELELHETEMSSAVVLAAQGRLDSTSSAVLERRLRDMVAAGRTRIVLDLERVGYISSAGLRVLVVAGKLLADHAGRIILSGLSSENRRLFDLSGFTDLFAIAADRAQAVAELE
jgi:anti-sigma B factor antagonist